MDVHPEMTLVSGVLPISIGRKNRDESDYNQVWLVCDVDQFDVSATATLAHSQGIELAWSNPCFEVWLIIHLREGCPPFADATQAVDCLRKLLPRYNKEELDFADFSDHLDEAIQRAKRLGGPPQANPSTGVGKLIEELRSALR